MPKAEGTRRATAKCVSYCDLVFLGDANQLAIANWLAFVRHRLVFDGDHDIREPGLWRLSQPAGAAMRLGIPRSTLESKIRALKIDKSLFRTGATRSS